MRGIFTVLLVDEIPCLEFYSTADDGQVELFYAQKGSAIGTLTTPHIFNRPTRGPKSQLSFQKHDSFPPG